RQCLTAAQRDRRAAQRAAQADDVTTPVTHAAIQALPAVTQTPVPGRPAAEQGLPEALQHAEEHTQQALSPEAARVLEPYRATALSPVQAQALVAYQAQAEECERLCAQISRRSPYSPGVLYDPAVRQLEALRRQCLDMGVDASRLHAR